MKIGILKEQSLSKPFILLSRKLFSADLQLLTFLHLQRDGRLFGTLFHLLCILCIVMLLDLGKDFAQTDIYRERQSTGRGES